MENFSTFHSKAQNALEEMVEIISLQNKEDIKNLKKRAKEDINNDEFSQLLFDVFGSRAAIKHKNGWIIIKTRELVDSRDLKIITEKTGRYFVIDSSMWSTKILFKINS